MANLTAFYETRNLFIQYTGFVKPLTFEQWAAVPESQKSAVLFVQFFDQMTMAWDKTNAFDFIPGEDGVSIVLQYLEKNVSRIMEAPKKFTPAYIYRVAYNCMYCICHDLKSVNDRWENETSNIVSHDSEELNLFDTVSDARGSAEETYEDEMFNATFWAIIEKHGVAAEKVMRYLLSGDPKSLKKVRKNAANYAKDPLRDVEVSLDAVEDILEDLKADLAGLHAALN